MKRILTVLILTLACHRAPPVFGRVLERGGEVPGDDTKTVVTRDAITAWGMIEVPDGSRLHAAYAGADAVARAELLRPIRVHIADTMVSVDSTDPARRTAYEHTVEAVAGRLRRAGTPQHGWERVQQSDRILLRVWSKLTVPQAEIETALQELKAR